MQGLISGCSCGCYVRERRPLVSAIWLTGQGFTDINIRAFNIVQEGSDSPDGPEI